MRHKQKKFIKQQKAYPSNVNAGGIKQFILKHTGEHTNNNTGQNKHEKQIEQTVKLHTKNTKTRKFQQGSEVNLASSFFRSSDQKSNAINKWENKLVHVTSKTDLRRVGCFLENIDYTSYDTFFRAKTAFIPDAYTQQN